MTRRELNAAENARRIWIARAVVTERGGTALFAERAGLKHSNACQWLRRHAPEEYRQLRRGRGPQASPGATLARLKAIREASHTRGGRKQLAYTLGVTQAALAMCVKRHAPDGIDAAIADLEHAADAPAEPRRAA